MAERQETVHVVMRWEKPAAKNGYNGGAGKPAKVFDDRRDARSYVRQMNSRSRRYSYYYVSVKKG